MQNPLVSIIIPCYNHGKYIHACVESIQTCTFYDKVEIIIVNDGSTDDGFTFSQIEAILDSKVYKMHTKNQGLAKARNTGIKNSTAPFILPLDADNAVSKHFISVLYKAIQHSDADIAYGDRVIVQDAFLKTKRKNTGEFDARKLALGNYIDACALYKRSVFETLGGYDEYMPVMGFEDWDFWIRAFENRFRFTYVPQAYFYYRDLPNSMLKDTTAKYETVSTYVVKKNAAFFAAQWRTIALEQSYKQRKPILYWFKKLFPTLFAGIKQAIGIPRP